MGTHSCVIAPHLKDSLSTSEADGSKYGRMFPDLPGLDVDETFLLTLGRVGSVMDASSRQDDKDGQSDNLCIPAGFPFFGQFIAHDITADRSLLLHHASLTEIPEQHSLAYRDLERGEALELPSGEAVARAMGVEPLSKDEVGLNQLGWNGETPLWFYILKEAEVRHGGQKLCDVGGRIVAEVLLSLIDADPNSFRNAATEWKPTLPVAQQGYFTIADLLRFARVV